MVKNFHEISFNDYSGGISIFLIIPYCSTGCSYCFNKSIWNINAPDFMVYEEIINKHKRKIKHFVLGGGNICEPKNQKLVKKICDYLHGNNLSIHLQINAQNLKYSMSFLKSIPFDSVRLSLNNLCEKDIKYVDELYSVCDDITTCLVFTTSDDIGVPKGVKVDELVVDAEMPELYNQARQYAREEEIPILVSSQYGKEDL